MWIVRFPCSLANATSVLRTATTLKHNLTPISSAFKTYCTQSRDDEEDPLKVNAIAIDSRGEPRRLSLPVSQLVDYGGGKKLPIRDLRRIFSKNYMLAANAPVILPRPESGCFLLDLISVKVVCKAGECLILHPEEFSSLAFAEDLVKFVTAERAGHKEGKDNNKRLATRLATAKLKKGELSLGLNPALHGYLNAIMGMKNVTFELIVLETALLHVTLRFQRHLRLVKPVYDMVITDIQEQPDESRLRQLLAFRKSLNSFDSMVSKVRHAVREVLSQDEDMAALYLSEKRAVEDHEEVELLLEAYYSDLKEIEDQTIAMKETILDTNDFINTHLDSARNRLIQLSVLMEMGTLSIASGAMITGIFGMNLTNGFEQNDIAFFVTCGGIAGLSALIFVSLARLYVRMNRDTKGARKYQALVSFFQYIDELEKLISREGKEIFTKKDLRAILRRILGKEVSMEEVELIFNIFDEDQNGVLEAKEFANRLKAQKEKEKEKDSGDDKEKLTVEGSEKSL